MAVFSNCCFGGRREKWTAVLTNSQRIYEALNWPYCHHGMQDDYQPYYDEYGYIRYPTEEEAEYPQQMCQAYAMALKEELVAKGRWPNDDRFRIGEIAKELTKYGRFDDEGLKRKAMAYRWKQDAHINELETQALVAHVRRLLKETAVSQIRVFVVIDSQVLFYCLGKGRSASKRLNRLLKRLASLELAGDLFVGLKPRTLKSYRQALRRFFDWLEAEEIDIPGKPSDLDELLASFLEHLWLDDINVTYAGHTLSAFRRFYPQLRFKLPVSRQFFSNWKSVHVTKQAIPLPGDVAMAAAGVALASDEWSLAALLLVGFAAFLRTGEIVGLQTSHIDVCEQSGHIILALPSTKTSKQRMESVAIQDKRLASLLQLAIELAVTPFVASLTPNGFRARLALLLAHLELQDHNFTAYSIRRGGATHAFANGHHFDTLLVKGRWQSVKTARQYLDSGRAALVQLQFSDQSHELIRHYGQFASNFCGRLRQKRTSHC
eukprot:Skav222553  [mRNA]  locus=scaffold2837:372454:374148:- [translate_table: standard]